MADTDALNMITGAALSTTGNLISSKLDFDENKRMVDYLENYAREDWNMQNEYNEAMYNKYGSPSALVKQYKEAGLNPAALAGTQPTQSVSNSSAPATQSSGYRSKYDISGAALSGLAAALSVQRQQSEIANIDANTQKTNAETDQISVLLPGREESLRLQNSLAGITIEGQSIQNSIADTQRQILEATTKAQVDSLFENLNIMREQRKQMEFKTDKQADEFDLWMQNQMIDLAVKSASINLVDAQRALTQEQVNTEIAKQSHLYKEVSKISAEVESLDISNEERRRTFESRVAALEAQNKDLKRTSSVGYRVWTEIKDAFAVASGFVPLAGSSERTESFNPVSGYQMTTKTTSRNIW